ncbi:MAG TPA: winged helix-turn-helix domain-containing protein [Blastocatellia bacterium]|nr:winged helix-turn-helix domain-containing protein [Blastocatellia bacterium]
MSRRVIKTNLTEFSIASTPGRSLYHKVYRAIMDSILSGELPPGSRLPSTRSLATSLNISRNSVSHAYEQLFSEGYIEGKVGSGTYVSRQLPESAKLRRRAQRRQKADLKVADLLDSSKFPFERIDADDSEGNPFYIYSSR